MRNHVSDSENFKTTTGVNLQTNDSHSVCLNIKGAIFICPEPRVKSTYYG